MIKIIAAGRIKEKYFEDAVSEYLKRLSPYAKVSILQVADEKAPENLSLKEAEAVKEKEAERMLKHIKNQDYVISLEIKGKSLSSEEFSELIGKLEVTGKSDIDFVIGGSLGLAETVSKRADLKLSFSEMTFPHQLMRVVLLEQIYRAYKILKNEPYHK